MACKTILIVEDDQSIRSTLKLALEIQGYTVFAAANGKEGLETLSQMPKPCLILLDLMMPVMDGWGFAEALGQDANFAHIPVIVITAFSDVSRDKAEALRAKLILGKPLDLDILFREAAKYCS